jgi:glycosyltransferase involved in cell wall biosynthesis
VEFTGFVPEPEKLRLLRGAWVHVLTSPKEGWGISVLEAAACGTTTVASDSPGLRDSVIDGETGFLVPHNDVTALAKRIGQVLDDAHLRERLGQAARQFADRHTWERAADEMEAFLSEVARTKPR